MLLSDSVNQPSAATESSLSPSFLNHLDRNPHTALEQHFFRSQAIGQDRAIHPMALRIENRLQEAATHVFVTLFDSAIFLDLDVQALHESARIALFHCARAIQAAFGAQLRQALLLIL